ncbi:tripartite tricarboxylate transporter substrate binding protein [soil metagenome]
MNEFKQGRIAAAFNTAVATFARVAITSVALLATSAHAADDYPNRPIHVVLGFAAGGVIDGFMRQIAPALGQQLGQPIIVDNKPGANGVLAMDAVAKSPADGYSVFLGALGNFSLNELFYAKLPYNFDTDFAPVTQLNSVSFLVYANPALPVSSMGELVAYAKAHPGTLNYSSTGNGSTPNLAAEMVNSLAGIKITHVPYKGSGQSMTDLLGGQVQMTIDAVAIGMPQVKSGKLKVLAATGKSRLASLPDVPTVAETLPGYEVTNWYGFAVPKATPRDVVTRLQAAVAKVLASPELRDRMAADGMEPVASTSEQFGSFIKSESAKWRKVVNEAGIKVE